MEAVMADLPPRPSQFRAFLGGATSNDSLFVPRASGWMRICDEANKKGDGSQPAAVPWIPAWFAFTAAFRPEH